MLSKPFKLLFVITAYSPVILIWWIVRVFTKVDEKGNNKIISFSDITLDNLQNNWYLLAIFIGLVLFCYYIMFLIKKELTKNFIEIKSIKSADLNMSALLISYFLPCVELYKKDTIYIALWICCFILLIFINKNTFFYNPLMKLFGYRYYQIVTKDVEYTMISKEKLINQNQVNSYSQITDYVIYNSTTKK